MAKVFIICMSILLIFAMILGGCTNNATTTAKPAPAPSAPAAATSAPAPASSAAPAPAVSTTSAPAPPASTSKAPAAPPSSTQPAAPSGIQTGGTMHVVTTEGFQNLGDPRQTGPPMDSCLRHIFIETLLRFDKSGNLIPWLASSWKYTNDFKSLTLTLQQGVRYQDGTDFNAQSVKDCLEAYKAAGMKEMQTVTSFEVVDNFNVRLNTAAYDATLLGLLAQAPCGQMISPAAMKKYAKDEISRTPVGTGAFKLASLDPGNKFVANKNPDYWIKGKPYLDSIEVTYIKDPTVAKMAFEKGEADVIPRMDPPQGTDLIASGKYKNLFISPAGFEFMLAGDVINPDSPWSKLDVRQAAMYAVDIDSIVKKIGQGVSVVCRRMFQANSPYYNPAPVPYSYNPTKAKELLQKAGYGNGFTTSIWLRSPNFQDYAVATQAYFADVGIKSSITVMTTAVAADMTTKGWKNGLLEVLAPNTAEREASSVTIVYYGPNNKYNASLSVPQDVVDLCNQAMNQPDISKRKALAVQVDDLVIDKYALLMNYATIPFIVPKQSWLHDENFRFFVGHYWTPEQGWVEKH